MLFFGVVIFTHIFIDSFNNYGTGWLEPFSHERISFNIIYVADPFFSLWPGIACIMLLYLNRYTPKRKKWWRSGIIVPFLYLAYCSVNKIKIDTDIKYALNEQKINYTRYFTTPAPLQNWLWYVVAGNDKGYYVGFRSLFDKNKSVHFEYFPRNDSLLKPVSDHEDLQKLIRFSQHFYTVEQWNDTLVFNDLRFGQMIGWQNARGHFVFHYYLQHPDDNKLVVQRGRFAGWNMQTARSLARRIGGK
jgi:inner membrane protein